MPRGSELRRQKVYDLVKQYLPHSAKVLEISCGRGEILERLRNDGYIVRGTNYTKYEDICESVEIDLGVDLLKGLPYEDESYDCVILSDVIQHLSDHNAAIKEISRVVKKGGYIIVTTQNIMRISSRIHFLLTGFFKIKRVFIGFDVPHDKAFAFHNYPSHLPTFLYQIHSHNLECLLVDAVGYKAKSYIFWLLFIPFILPATYYKNYIVEDYIIGSGVSKFLSKTLVSFKILCGESWVVMGRKKSLKSENKKTGTKLPIWSEKY